MQGMRSCKSHCTLLIVIIFFFFLLAVYFSILRGRGWGFENSFFCRCFFFFQLFNESTVCMWINALVDRQVLPVRPFWHCQLSWIINNNEVRLHYKCSHLYFIKPSLKFSSCIAFDVNYCCTVAQIFRLFKIHLGASVI